METSLQVPIHFQEALLQAVSLFVVFLVVRVFEVYLPPSSISSTALSNPISYIKLPFGHELIKLLVL